MDLFEYSKTEKYGSGGTAGVQASADNAGEVVGQQHIIGKDKLLYRAIKADKLSSIIFLWTAGNR